MNETTATTSERSGVLGRLRGKGAPPPPAHGTDALTGLPTRQALPALIEEATAASRPTSTHTVLVFVDLDSLRDVNDSYGPDAGDAVLTEAAARLATLDLYSAKTVRWGGAELAIVLQRVQSLGGADEIANAVLGAISAPYRVGQDDLAVTCHLGLAVGGDAAGTSTDLIRDAHHALVEARELGHSGYVTHDESRKGRYSTRIDEARLHAALDNDEFVLHYQPIVRTDTDQLIGVEALLRWRAPGATTTGLLFPHDFLPLLEKSGLIVPVGLWVIEQTCRQALAWAQAHPQLAPLFVTCNLGARQLAVPDFASEVLRVVEAVGVSPHQLCLDVTEETVRYNGASTWAALRSLKEAGVKLGLDDFGRGAASLAAVREINLDLLRIDRLFIEDLANSTYDQAIVRNMSNLAHDLQMVTVVEGIEHDDQRAVLPALGVDLAQGFLYGRPEPADTIDTWLGTGPEQHAGEKADGQAGVGQLPG